VLQQENMKLYNSGTMTKPYFLEKVSPKLYQTLMTSSDLLSLARMSLNNNKSINSWLNNLTEHKTNLDGPNPNLELTPFLQSHLQFQGLELPIQA
jgi:hypothetical protein